MRLAITGLVATIALPSLADPVESSVEGSARKTLLDQAAHAGWINPEIEVAVVTANRTAFACRQSVAVEALDVKYPSRMRFVAVCPGGIGTRQEFTVRAAISAEVLVAANSIPSGRPLREQDFSLERRDVSNVPDAVSDIAAVVDQTTNRSLRVGQLLLRPMLLSPVLVKRGDAVRIVARTGPVEVSNAGEALENGRAQDTVRVRNTATGKIVRARVIGSGAVEPLGLPTFPEPQSLE